MNAELEKWIDKNEALAGEFSSGLSVVPSYKLIALFDGKVLVPVDALREVIRISDRDHEAWDAVKAALAASQEQGK
jgi:hypothetical protein